MDEVVLALLAVGLVIVYVVLGVALAFVALCLLFAVGFVLVVSAGETLRFYGGEWRTRWRPKLSDWTRRFLSTFRRMTGS